MKRINRNKRGFTLVEMMLALAIITIIGWTTVALMIAIRDSFMTTYNTNDSSDYAVLYSQGLENAFLRHTQDKSAGAAAASTFYINPANSYLMDGSIEVFKPLQMKTKNVNTGNVVDKWQVRVFFKFDDKQVLRYRVFVLDNYYSPNTVMAVHDNSVWAPHLGYGKKRVTTSNTHSTEAVNKYLRDNYTLTSPDKWDDWFDTVSYAP